MRIVGNDGWPVADREVPTTQLLLPGSRTEVSPAPPVAAPRYCGSNSSGAWAAGTRAAAITSSVIALTSRLRGRGVVGGIGIARPIGLADAQAGDAARQLQLRGGVAERWRRSTSCSIVHGSGTMPVTVNSIGRRSVCCAMNALTPSRKR